MNIVASVFTTAKVYRMFSYYGDSYVIFENPNYHQVEDLVEKSKYHAVRAIFRHHGSPHNVLWVWDAYYQNHEGVAGQMSLAPDEPFTIISLDTTPVGPEDPFKLVVESRLSSKYPSAVAKKDALLSPIFRSAFHPWLVQR